MFSYQRTFTAAIQQYYTYVMTLGLVVLVVGSYLQHVLVKQGGLMRQNLMLCIYRRGVRHDSESRQRL